MISMSFAFLPIIIIAPSKFANLFTLGSICLISSIAVIKGFTQFKNNLIAKDKLQYTIYYLISIAGTLYYCFIGKSYLLVLAFSIL